MVTPIKPDDRTPRTRVRCETCGEDAKLIRLEMGGNFGIECACGTQEMENVEWGDQDGFEDGMNWNWTWDQDGDDHA